MQQLPNAAYQLGPPSSVHQPSRRTMVSVGIVAGILLALGVAGLLTGARAGSLAGTTAGVLFAAAGAALVWAGIIRRAHRRVLVAPNGLVTIDGTTVAHYPWDEVQAIYQTITQIYVNGIPQRKTQRYSLYLRDGRRLKVDQTLTDIATLGQAMQQQVTQRLLAAAAASVNAGETLSFGDFRVNQTGVSKGAQSAPWNQIGGVRFVRGAVFLDRRDGRGVWARAPIAKTPNIFVLQAIVNAMVGRAAPVS
jgi:hypothetical protein